MTKLTSAQKFILLTLADGEDPLAGADLPDSYRGRMAGLDSLAARGFIVRLGKTTWELTEEGRTLAESFRPREEAV